MSNNEFKEFRHVRLGDWIGYGFTPCIKISDKSATVVLGASRWSEPRVLEIEPGADCYKVWWESIRGQAILYDWPLMKAWAEGAKIVRKDDPYTVIDTPEFPSKESLIIQPNTIALTIGEDQVAVPIDIAKKIEGLL